MDAWMTAASAVDRSRFHPAFSSAPTFGGTHQEDKVQLFLHDYEALRQDLA